MRAHSLPCRGCLGKRPFTSLYLYPRPRRIRAARVYQARKNAKEGKGDVVFNQLTYVPTCTHMVRSCRLSRSES